MKHIKNIGTFLAGGLLGVVSTLATLNYTNNSRLPIETDVNGDGRPDIVVREGNRNQDAYILVQRKDGKYDACKMNVADGTAFFPTLDGTRAYDPYGQVFENKK